MKNKPAHRTPIYLGAFAVVMFAFGYALVPFYNVLCKTLGINGKTEGTAVSVAAVESIDKERVITIEFLATNNEGLPWEFRPQDVKVRLHPGEMRKTNYFAKNNSGKTMMVQAIPSVTPALAARYLRKTECFCFEQQTLSNQEAMDMPLLFHIDADLPKHINTITLSYTLFDVTGMNLKIDKEKSGRLS